MFVAATTGLRRAELCALRRRRDIDWEHGTARVAWSIVAIPGQPLEEIPTKNRRVRRSEASKCRIESGQQYEATRTVWPRSSDRHDDSAELFGYLLGEQPAIATGQISVARVAWVPRSRVGGDSIAEQDEYFAGDRQRVAEKQRVRLRELGDPRLPQQASRRDAADPSPVERRCPLPSAGVVLRRRRDKLSSSDSDSGQRLVREID